MRFGGPGAAIRPIDQAEALSALLGQPLRVRRVPVRMLDAIIAVLSTLGRLIPPLAAKAELARIGRHHATESMLVLDPETGRYDADVTPATGSNHLFDHYARLARGETAHTAGDHAVFQRSMVPRRGAPPSRDQAAFFRCLRPSSSAI